MTGIEVIVVMILVATGFGAVMLKRNLIKIVMGISIIGSGVNLFLVSMGYVEGGTAPIFTSSPATSMVLATPQALTLTSIVINLAVTALMLSLAISIHRHYGSADSRKRRLYE